MGSLYVLLGGLAIIVGLIVGVTLVARATGIRNRHFNEYIQRKRRGDSHRNGASDPRCRNQQ